MKPELISVTESPPSFELPELPSVIRYYDEFNDCISSIKHPKDFDEWSIFSGGSEYQMDFTKVNKEIREIIKYWVSHLIQTLASTTVTIRYSGLLRIAYEDQCQILNSSPLEIRSIWKALLIKNYKVAELNSLKSILHFFCNFNLSGWSSDYSEFLSTLPLPTVDKYSSVRTGDVFLSVDEEAILVEHIDFLSQEIQKYPKSVSDNQLNDTTILMCSFQFGMRPIQIAMLQMRDVRIWHDAGDSTSSVHLTFKMVKQRSRSNALPLTRKVKHDWSPLFVELFKRRSMKGFEGTDRIFQVYSSSDISQIIIKSTGALLPERRSARELRHTAAQRLVDAGASQEELAEFLGHSDIDTGLVYFQTSPNQAERVNRALGISEIYQRVSKIAHDRFISTDELSKLKGDQQIGGAPHGIPITGIGGCSTGQPSCPSNPVIACYGCRKFMPISDVEMHKKVLIDFREIVSFFSKSSRGDQNSPTYLQLKRTISNVQSVISEIEESRL